MPAHGGIEVLALNPVSGLRVPCIIDPVTGAVLTAEGGEPAPDSPLSPERTAVLSDLHWLVHQGHVIEYANGQMEIAPKPQPPQQKMKKPKPEKKTKPEPAADPVAAAWQ